MTFLNVDTEPRGRRPGGHPHRSGHGRQPRPDAADPRMSAVAGAARAPRSGGPPGGACSATGPSSRCSACSASSSSCCSARPAGHRQRRVGGRHPARRGPAGDPRRLPDADHADRRHRPVGRRGRLDGRVRRRDARQRARGWPVGASPSPSRSRRSRASSTGIGVGRLPGPPADHDPGHEPGRPRPRQRLAAPDGPDRVRASRRAPLARVRHGSCGVAAQQPARLRAARAAHPARAAADRLRPAAVRDRRQPDRGAPVGRPGVAGPGRPVRHLGAPRGGRRVPARRPDQRRQRDARRLRTSCRRSRRR